MPTAVITGSSRGIGRATALRYARDGYDVTVNYVSNEAAAEDTAAEIRSETDRGAIVVQADVGDPAAAVSLVESANDAFGGVDHVVNNAGIDQHVHTADLSPEDFDRVMDTNVNGAFAVTKAALPWLRESTVPEGPSVVNMSSVLAHTGAAIECHYAASKAALIALTKSHASDFAPDIRVNAIAPGHVVTEMMTEDRSEETLAELEAAVPLERFGRPADIAEAAAYLRDAQFVTGETLNVNGGELMV